MVSQLRCFKSHHWGSTKGSTSYIIQLWEGHPRMTVDVITFGEVGAQSNQELEIFTVSRLHNQIGPYLRFSCKVALSSLVFILPAVPREAFLINLGYLFTPGVQALLIPLRPPHPQGGNSKLIN